MLCVYATQTQERRSYEWSCVDAYAWVLWIREGWSWGDPARGSLSLFHTCLGYRREGARERGSEGREGTIARPVRAEELALARFFLDTIHDITTTIER